MFDLRTTSVSRMRFMTSIVASVLNYFAGFSAWAAGDYPISCKSWSGTVTERSGLDTDSARMRGAIMKADIQEYCERDPGGETKASGGRLTLAQCVKKYVGQERGVELVSQANCRTGTIIFHYGTRTTDRTRFPLGADADTSCASPLSNLIPQFKVLCPHAARRLGLE